MPKVKTYKLGDSAAPKFPTTVEIPRKAVLQKTDVAHNNNKYYAIELHSPATKTKKVFRVFTHYGRTDDLARNPDAGVKECRFFSSLGEAERCYDSIYRQKTGTSKGYKEVSLASSKIGSKGARGQSVGKVDAATLERDEAAKKKAAKQKAAKKKAAKKKAAKPIKLDPSVKALVEYIYAEATDALQKTVNVTITANGIETPLGILTLGQIEKGQAVLDALHLELQKKRKRKARLQALSSDFYSAIPHRIGRSRKAIEAAVIRTLADFAAKQDTLQLMRDMLSVSGAGEQESNVLYDGSVAERYSALGCEIEAIPKSAAAYKKWSKYVLDNQEYKRLKIVNLYKVERKQEVASFNKVKTKVGNTQHLFHGSSLRNWVGILSRGILMPKAVVSMGGSRTDEGWLGNGIYFSTESTTAAQYTYPGTKGTSLMAINEVALGKQKTYTEITYGITKPPRGYQSCYGISNRLDEESEFDDNEHVIYDTKQQHLDILVEFRG